MIPVDRLLVECNIMGVIGYSSVKAHADMVRSHSEFVILFCTLVA